MALFSLKLLALLTAIGILYAAYFAGVAVWEDQRSRGLGYFGLPASARRRYRSLLRTHRVLLHPAFWLVSRCQRFSFAAASIRVGSATAPKGSCSVASFEKAVSYVPGGQDIFVVTQMKCGTTWMQQLVYELLTRGQADLVKADRTLGSVSPWLESVRGVSVEEAPWLGTSRPARLIKTHLPASLCPFSPQARYIYVVRQPVSCFASCCDFLNVNLQMFAPPPDEIERWFCSSEMWWTAWPEHVAGWWHRSRNHDNVLLVHFERMKQDLHGEAERIARWLNLEPLEPAELELVLRHCGYSWMRDHAEWFESQPPHLLRPHPQLFIKGTLDRFRDVPETQAMRVAAWCRSELERREVPWRSLYPDAERNSVEGNHSAAEPIIRASMPSRRK
ncbi:MAG: sulfotransferase domain-containing protein [Pirellulaceae bacterium]|nr:sulfotransferase domain-containing protein [Pirellulaceae bacterium]